MSRNKAALPDAWDDDWEEQADRLDATPEPEPEVKLTTAQRKAKHVEANKQLWEAAETPEHRPMFLEARKDVPLKSDFKPAMKVLSRKPPPKVVNATSAMANASLDDDPDSEEEGRRKAEAEFAERQARAQQEREEKQRKYQEVRERLFGSTGAAAGEDHSRSSLANDGGSRNSSRGKGRVKGRTDGEASATPPTQHEKSPARPNRVNRQLFDPGYSAKPNSTHLMKRDVGGSGSSTPAEERAVREPKGPDSSGRGGFGFAPRGNRTGGS